MWRQFSLFAAQIGLALVISAPAFAASAISHSVPENVYGWCAGYAPGRADRCAQQRCQKQGGTACQIVVGCVGPGATAFAERPARGFGAACLGDERSARMAALIGCISATNSLCWTSVTFASNGRASDASANLRFDQVWIAQIALQLLTFFKEAADGSLSEATQAAVGAFQKEIGRAPTGTIDEELLRRMVDAVGGPRHLAGIIKRVQLSSLERQLVGAKPVRLFYTALNALPPEKPQQYFKRLNGEELKQALTTYMKARGAACKTPSPSVSTISESIWIVVCNDVTYNVVFNEGGYSMITGGGLTIIK
ncbi:MAG: peptidoglycan-binding protein [Xanthobacteraceae bacterium]|nr:peptidoglycan-binding protein [Xanthobacteraceae bacterium]